MSSVYLLYLQRLREIAQKDESLHWSQIYVVTLQELKEGGAKEVPLKEAPPSMCKDHDEQLKIFCFDCNHLICRDCIISDHAGHKFEFVKKSAPRYKKTLKESLAPLVKIQSNISAATGEVEKVEGEVSEQHEVIAGTIEKSCTKSYTNERSNCWTGCLN